MCGFLTAVDSDRRRAGLCRVLRSLAAFSHQKNTRNPSSLHAHSVFLPSTAVNFNRTCNAAFMYTTPANNQIKRKLWTRHGENLKFQSMLKPVAVSLAIGLGREGQPKGVHDGDIPWNAPALPCSRAGILALARRLVVTARHASCSIGFGPMTLPSRHRQERTQTCALKCGGGGIDLAHAARFLRRTHGLRIALHFSWLVFKL